ncbi:MAG: glycosyltransferase family 2 protein [Ignavibacteriae bacterium]|nr:glycosyltransferase family 2 protein [Ignavibacteriota bacterium]
MTVPKPLVSVGVPVYNGEQYLSQALDSLLCQSYSNLEIVIFDNASTDATEEICRRYAAKDSRIKYVRNASNLGAAANYNLTVRAAHGKYFKWAAHDDVCAPAFIEKCVDALEANPDVSLAYPKTTIIDAQGEFKSNHEDQFNFREKYAHLRWRQFCRAPIDCNAVFGVMRTDLLRTTPCIGAYESSDRVLLGEFALLGEIAEVPERLFLRRYHEKISTNINPTKRSMAQWFDPRSKGRFSRTRRFWEYVKSIFRVRLSMYQRLFCLYHLLIFYAQPFRWGRLIKGLIMAPFKNVRTAGNQI